MAKKHKEHRRRGSNPIVALFRLLISLSIFLVLLGGIYYAYREFSGFDPLKLSPESIKTNLFSKQKLADFGYDLLSFDIKQGLGRFIGKSAENNSKTIPEDNEASQTESAPKPSPRPAELFKFAVVADSHNDNDLLFKALNQAKGRGAEFVIGLGDYTDVGTLGELKDAKAQFDKAGLRYFVTAGDHDLWDSRDKNKLPFTNFESVFGKAYQTFDYKNVDFLILSNSDNYVGFGGEQTSWANNYIQSIKYRPSLLRLAFVHEPLYHPSSDHYMGRVTPALATQSKLMLKNLKEAGFREVFAGDVHYFTEYSEPETSLSMVTIGAVTQARNIEMPRYGIVTVLSDGSLKVDDVEIKQ